MLLLNIACCKVTIIYWIIANLAARKDFYRYSMTMHLLNVQPTSKRNVHQEGLCLACACCQHPLPVWLQYYKVYTLSLEVLYSLYKGQLQCWRKFNYARSMYACAWHCGLICKIDSHYAMMHNISGAHKLPRSIWVSTDTNIALPYMEWAAIGYFPLAKQGLLSI